MADSITNGINSELPAGHAAVPPGAGSPTEPQGTSTAAGAGAATAAGANTGEGTTTPAGGVAPSTLGQTNASAVTPPTWRDHFNQHGLDLSGYADDAQAVQQIVQTLGMIPRLRQLAMLGEQVQPNYHQYQAWLAEQQKAAQQKQAQPEESWWKKPEYDQSWLNKLVRDPATGQLRVADGQDPSILGKFNAWADHRTGFLDKFALDPIEAIKPGIEQVIKSVLAPMLQERDQQFTQQRAAEAIVAENADWLHERNQQGEVVRDAMGRKVLSVWGQRYAAYAQEAAQDLGITDPTKMHRYAMAQVKSDFANAQLAAHQRALQSQQAGQQGKDNFVNAARHAPNQGVANAGGTGGAPAAGRAAPIRSERDLADLLKSRLNNAGYRDGQLLETR